MDVLHDACFHTENDYNCMTSREEMTKSGQEDYRHLVKILYSSLYCTYQRGKYKGTKFLDKINHKLEAPSSKK